MLEVFAVVSLCIVNKKNALARGRRPGGFIALTIVLWIVFELIGLIPAYIISENRIIAMFIGLMCAGIGGLISFLIAKNVPQGNYVDPSTIRQPVVTVGPNGAPIYGNPNIPAYQMQQVPVQQMQPVQPFQPVQGAGPVAGMHYCRYCGAANNSTSKFCESCGQNIE